MERFLFAKVEAWLFLLSILVGFLLLIGFGAAVLDAERETNHLGRVGGAARAVAEIPLTLKRMLGPDSELLVFTNAYNDPFKGKPSGWNSARGSLTGLGGYLLVSRYDGTRSRHVIELVSFPALKTQRSWTLDVNTLLKGARISPFSDHDNWNDRHFREIHPWILPTGSLIVKDHNSPLMRVDSCGRRLWINDGHIFHHSTEADADGNLWIPSVAEPQTLTSVKPTFRDDMIAKVGLDGKLLYQRSVAEILIGHGLANEIFSNDMYNADPIHLNDIQPVLQDGPYWKKGDLFLSLRNISTIMLYRPSTNEIVWMKRGPWLSQHDVDIVDDHRIAVYNNNVQDRGTQPFFEDSSSVLVYDFHDGKISSPLAGVMRSMKLRTTAAGLFTMLPSGFTIIEDEVSARLLIVRPDGKLGAEYVNRAKNGHVYHLGWSRYVDQSLGDAILANIAKEHCDA